jgi:hypothetical protein
VSSPGTSGLTAPVCLTQPSAQHPVVQAIVITTDHARPRHRSRRRRESKGTRSTWMVSALCSRWAFGRNVAPAAPRHTPKRRCRAAGSARASRRADRRAEPSGPWRPGAGCQGELALFGVKLTTRASTVWRSACWRGGPRDRNVREPELRRRRPECAVIRASRTCPAIRPGCEGPLAKLVCPALFRRPSVGRSPRRPALPARRSSAGPERVLWTRPSAPGTPPGGRSAPLRARGEQPESVQDDD